MRIFIPLLTLLIPLSQIHAGSRLDSTATPPDVTKAPPPQLEVSQTLNLGATGAKGWIHGHKHSTMNSRQVYITQVAPGTPSAKLLKAGDVILGIGGSLFSSDARVSFGKALTEAEAGNGKLELLRWRDGKKESVVLKLPMLGGYSATAPYDCPKSARILEQGCEFIAKRIKAGTSRDGPTVRSLNALALLASGNAEYMPLVKQEADWAAAFKISGRKAFRAWHYGYATIFLAEYAAASGDRSVMPGLERLSLAIARGQSSVGSWGHSFASPDGCLYGYGSMNQPGLSCTVAMLLARKAGVEDADLDRAIKLSQRFLEFYIDKGAVPYGDHDPWLNTHEDNGKCGSATVMFDLLGDSRGTAFFSRMSLASHNGERDTGHTGNFHNLLWAMPGVSRSGPRATGAWIKEFGWYLDLARCADGSYGYQGEPGQKRETYRNWDCSGAYLLAYAMPLKKLFISGKVASSAPPLDAGAVATTIADGRGYDPFTRTIAQSQHSPEQLLADLSSWSPIVRQRAARELAKRKLALIPELIKMVDSADRYSRYGGCVALEAQGVAAAPAMPALHKCLTDDDLWVRILAARVLARIGDASVLPELLKLASAGAPNDPREQVQRYLAFSLFGAGRGSARIAIDSFDSIKLDQLYPAVEAILRNQNGQVRSSVTSIFTKLEYDQIAPLLPAIYKAIVEPAPSGVMFADGIRCGGLELLAKYHIREGLPLCVPLMDVERWGKKGRIGRCLKALKLYGAAAKTELPALRKLEQDLVKHREAKMLAPHLETVRKLIVELEGVKDADVSELRAMPR